MRAERAVFGADPGDGGRVETALPAVGGREAGREFRATEPTAERVGHVRELDPASNKHGVRCSR